MGRYEITNFNNSHSVDKFNRMMKEVFVRLAAVEQKIPSGSLSTTSASALQAQTEQIKQTKEV